MPNVLATNTAGEEVEDAPSHASWDSDDECRDRWAAEDEQEEERRQKDPDEEGKYHDDPLWYGKSSEQIRYATELEKSNGNAASRDGDWKKANRYWKNALKGAEKLVDLDTEVRLRLNLALGYVQRQKPDKALMHCDEVTRERLKSAAAKAPGLLAKTHYRRAEAYIVSGDEAKANRALRAVLEVDPRNTEARRRLSELKKLEQDRRARERALYSGKLPAEAEDESPAEDEPLAEGEAPWGSAPKIALSQDHDESLTDRQASARLVQGLRGENLNFRVGQPACFFGPRSS